MTGYYYPIGIPIDICQYFEELALYVYSTGIDHYSSDAILHQIRWQYEVERGHRDFKCNNNWTAELARWFLKRHPEIPDFFELRVRRNGGED